jgi:hypothetical protein
VSVLEVGRGSANQKAPGQSHVNVSRTRSENPWNACTYPLVFRDVVLIRNGSTFSPAVVVPRRGDIVRPVS